MNQPVLTNKKLIEAITAKVQERLGVEKPRELVKEAVVLIANSFASFKTEMLSGISKELHLSLYKKYIDNFNAISAKLDSMSRLAEGVDNPDSSEYRRLKVDEQHNLNGVKLHDLYFKNVSDRHSEIRMDSLPFIRLSRDWGTFENWQLDFRSCGMMAQEGWVVLYYEPMKQRYVNAIVEGNSTGFPVCGIPVLVIDTFHHAWWKDYPGDKMSYLNKTMQEIAWNIVEARMVVAEASNLSQLYMIEPSVSSVNVQVNTSTTALNTPPIGSEQQIKNIGVK